MDGMEFVNKLAEKARQSNPGKIDITDKVMDSIRTMKPAIDLAPVSYCTGIFAVIASFMLIATFMADSSQNDFSSIINAIMNP